MIYLQTKWLEQVLAFSFFYKQNNSDSLFLVKIDDNLYFSTNIFFVWKNLHLNFLFQFFQ